MSTASNPKLAVQPGFRDSVTRNCQGQTLLEFTFSMGLVLITLTGAGWLLKAYWDRTRCAYLVFETTHAQLVGRVLPRPFRLNITVGETSRSVEGKGVCGDVHEQVILNRLEEVESP